MSSNGVAKIWDGTAWVPAIIGAQGPKGDPGIDIDEGSGFADGDILVYDANWDVWVPQAPAEAPAFWKPISGATYGGLGNTTSTPILGQLHFYPLYFPSPTALTNILVEVTVAGSAGAVIRLGLYEQGSDGRPSNLIVDAGTVSSETTGVKEVTISETVTGLVYMAAVLQGDTCTVRVVGSPVRFFPASFNSVGNAAVNSFSVPREINVTGVLPAVADASSNVTPPIAIFVRVA